MDGGKERSFFGSHVSTQVIAYSGVSIVALLFTISAALLFLYTTTQTNIGADKRLKQYFWWASLSRRFSGAVDTSLAADRRRMDTILAGTNKLQRRSGRH